MKQKLSKREAMEVLEKLDYQYPDAKAELEFSNPFELLIATILSAQCTDAQVNKTTQILFQELKSPKDYLTIPVQALEEKIRSCGFYKNKAKNIRNACEVMEAEYQGVVPNTMEELMKLPGVGRKTANVVLSNAYQVPGIAVDTHVFRVANRIGIVKEKDVLSTEKALMKIIPKDLWSKSHHLLIFHGRRVCRARKPLCMICTIKEHCLYFQKSEGDVRKVNEKSEKKV